MRVVITGGAGNLGTKLRLALEQADWVDEIAAIDVHDFEVGGKSKAVVADLADPFDERWLAPVRAADGIVHYASANPAPTSSWAESAKSFDMTANLLENAGGGTRPCRFVFASSNHAMGGYKDDPLPGGEKLRMSTPQVSGTRYWDGQMYRWGAAYGATKMLGERLCMARAAATKGRITAVATRIGWCQRGDNVAATLSNGGGDRNEPSADVVARNLKWYRNMWLSNADHIRLMDAALRADAGHWPAPAIVVNGMSNNAGMPWDLEDGRAWIGYDPKDDVWADLGKAGLA
jgi:nucleoside-diphosphate-sugar epimerase